MYDLLLQRIQFHAVVYPELDGDFAHWLAPLAACPQAILCPSPPGRLETPSLHSHTQAPQTKAKAGVSFEGRGDLNMGNLKSGQHQ
jgi:hypothetical protein